MSTNLATVYSNEFQLLSFVVEHYGLQLLEADNCRKVWRLRTSEGEKYLKKTKLTEGEIHFIHEVLKYLSDRNFQTAPRYHLSINGEPFVKVNKEYYVLTDWYSGMELNFEIESDLKQAAQYLAKFHLCAEGFEPSVSNQRTYWFSWPSILETRIQELNDFRRLALVEKETSAFSRLYLRHFEPFYRQAVQSYQHLLESFYQPVAWEAYRHKSLCHHDYSSRNLLRSNECQLFLVDFDYTIRDLRIHDLINLMIRNLRHNEWNSEIGHFILSEYDQISKISADEIEVMYDLLSWPQDFWQIGLQYYYEKLPWPSKRFLRKLERRIESRFFREKFLKDFPSCNGIFHWQEDPIN